MELHKNSVDAERVVHLLLVSDADTAPDFKRAIESYGAASVVGLGSPHRVGSNDSPTDSLVAADPLRCLSSLDYASTVFFVMMPMNGHVVNWDLGAERTFLPTAIATLAKCKFGFLQVLWARHDSSQLLRRLSSRIAAETSSIQKTTREQVKVYDRNLGRETYEWQDVYNPEYHSDFRTYGPRIAAQLATKAPFASLVWVIRGAMSPQMDLMSGIADADPTTLESHSPINTASLAALGPIGERLVCAYSHNPSQLVDLVRRRIPSPTKALGDWIAEYGRPDRSSPVVQPIIPQELSLIVHFPDVSSLPVRKVGGW